VTAMPVSSGIVRRFVAGESDDAAVATVRRLIASGRAVSVDYLGENVADRAQAHGTRDAYVGLLRALKADGLTPAAEVSIKLSALGLLLGSDGEAIALDNARAVVAAATEADTTVTVDMEDHTTTDATLRVVRAMRLEYPDTGVVVQSQLRRTEADCRDLAVEGSRVRLCKGAYAEPEGVAYARRADVDRSYVRCVKILLAGPGYPMIATHDPRLIDITAALTTRYRRARGTYEYQMLYGIRPEEQRRLVDLGETMRVYLPYGAEWYGYLMRRMAEKPANAAVFLRSLVTRR